MVSSQGAGGRSAREPRVLTGRVQIRNEQHGPRPPSWHMGYSTMSDFAGMEELLRDFLVEAGDLLSQVDNKLVDLERTPSIGAAQRHLPWLSPIRAVPDSSTPRTRDPVPSRRRISSISCVTANSDHARSHGRDSCRHRVVREMFGSLEAQGSQPARGGRSCDRQAGNGRSPGAGKAIGR